MTTRTSVLLVSATLGGGGAERFTSTLLQHLDRDRFEPHLCVLRGPISYALPDDVAVAVLDKTRPHHIPRTVWRLRRLIARTRPDVVLGNMLYTNWLVGAAILSMNDQPRWVARYAAPPTIFETRWDRLLAPIVRGLLGRADGHVANSRALTEAVRAWLPATAERVNTVYNPVDVAAIDRDAAEPLADVDRPEVPRLVWAGRLERQKRPDVMLHAFARVRRSTDATLWILGEGSLQRDMERLADELGIAADVRFLGFDPEPYRWIRHGTLFVLTSDYEGFPNALLEAQALGLPAVSTDCPTGPDEIIDNGVTGLLARTGDAEAVAAGILHLLDDPERRGAMGRAARERVRSLCALEPVIEQWEDTILAMIGESDSRPGDRV